MRLFVSVENGHLCACAVTHRLYDVTAIVITLASSYIFLLTIFADFCRLRAANG